MLQFSKDISKLKPADENKKSIEISNALIFRSSASLRENISKLSTSSDLVDLEDLTVALESLLNKTTHRKGFTNTLQFSQEELALIENSLTSLGFKENINNYANFFQNIRKSFLPKLQDEMRDDKQLEPSLTSLKKILPNISSDKDYIFEETELTEEIAKKFMLELFSNHSEIVNTLKQDAEIRMESKLKGKGAGKSQAQRSLPRCISMVSTLVTDAKGNSEIVTIVGISGHIQQLDVDCLLYKTHGLFKNNIDKITFNITYNDKPIAVRFEYCEHADEKYDWLLEQVRENLNPESLENQERAKFLPLRPCAEKKVYSELTKQFLNQEGHSIHILGESNVYLPAQWNTPHVEEEVRTPSERELVTLQSLLANAQEAIHKSNEKISTLNVQMANLETEKNEGKLTTSQFKKQRNKVANKITNTRKDISKNSENIVNFNERIGALNEQIEVEKSKSSQSSSHKIFNLPFENEARAVSCKLIAACENCQFHKIAYTTIMGFASQIGNNPAASQDPTKLGIPSNTYTVAYSQKEEKHEKISLRLSNERCDFSVGIKNK